MVGVEQFVIAIMYDNGHIEPMETGRRYGRQAAIIRAEELNKSLDDLRLALAIDRFVVYSLEEVEDNRINKKYL
jgi:hypothetical protein